MNILNFHHQLVTNYQRYIQSFLNIKDPDIATYVETELQQKKLWPEPLVQFNPTFEKGSTLQKLSQSGRLHPELHQIFEAIQLYRHQEEAIQLGVDGREFIVTSGTGSGKSLTYLVTIMNHILNAGEATVNRTQAVIVYPMNALINSQKKAIDEYKTNYENKFKKSFPITFGQYTGQEDEAIRESMRQNPPHLLLTNYMMLELIMTRAGKDIEIRQNILANIKFLVFDELHTYRGRQGSDVALLIRRIKAAAWHPIICIGTSATTVASETATLKQQKEAVAEFGSLIFGSNIQAEQIIQEYLVRSIDENIQLTPTIVTAAVNQPIDLNGTFEEFENHPTAHWVEAYIALEQREGILVRRKPISLPEISRQLAAYCSLEVPVCAKHLIDFLNWANHLNSPPNKQTGKNYLPFRIHQFIAQTGSVYATLGDQKCRLLFMDAGLYANDKDTFIFPLVFSRTSGHEFYCVRLDENEERIVPRAFEDFVDDDEDALVTTAGYIFMPHPTDEEPVWDEARDLPELPESWFN
ncbi:DEAD/DEAH box helicase, partial [candidate division KSB1 bacterium]|nr:DEAD/DEAH box helicase [candidate division KSB1 bacterium]